MAFACAGIAHGQSEQYRERQVLTPEEEQWRATAPDPAETPEGTLDVARSLLARGEADEARDLLEDWVEQSEDDDRYFEGVYLLGEACFEDQDYYAAFEQYEIVVENTAGDLFQKSLRRELDVARAFLAGEKRIVWGFLRLPATDEALEILDRIWERAPGTRIGEEALVVKADYYFNRGDVDLAQDEYAHLAVEYPGGRFVQKAMLRSAEAAAAAFPGIKFDAGPLLEAEARYRQVQARFPALAERENIEERLEDIRSRRAEKELDIAGWYERAGYPAAAEAYYRFVIRDWPDTLAAAEARSRLRALGVDIESEEGKP